MASKKQRKKSRPPVRRVQRWYQQTGRVAALDKFPPSFDIDGNDLNADYRIDYVDRKRHEERIYLIDAVKRLRPYFEGFESSKGFDLRYPETWTKAQADKVRRYAHQVGQILAQPNVKRFRPRSKPTRRALEVYTGQRYKNQKAFPIILPGPNSRAIVREGKVEIRKKVKGGEVRDRFYLFEEVFGERPDTWDDIIEMSRVMTGELPYKQSTLFDEDSPIAKIRMPKGYYTIWTESNGDTGKPVEKRFITRHLREFFDQYGMEGSEFYHAGFEDVIIGFHFQSSDMETARAQKAAIDALRNKVRLQRVAARARRKRMLRR